ncbi:MAG: chromosome segregation protein SMC, partial [Bdellovibrionales bacterium]|nr:chromosome segregation protein SMC [Bdellovibrionales bacterium]
AMEAALGQKFQVLLSESTGDIVDAVDYLKDHKSGRSSFVAKGWIHEEGSVNTSEVSNREEVIALLEDVVKVPSSHKDEIRHFLKGVAVVQDVRSALKLRPEFPGWSFVTLEGDTLSSDGILTGGASEGADSGLLRRKREIKELSQKREEWAGKLSLASAYLKKLEGQLENLEEELEKAKREKSEKEILIAGLSKDLERAEAELKNAQTAVDRQTQEVDKIDANLSKLNEDLNVLRESLQEMREKRLTLETQVAELDEELSSSKKGIGDLQADVSRLGAESASKRQEAQGLKAQLEMLDRSLGEVRSELEKMSEETVKNSESMSQNQILIEEKRVELDQCIYKAEQLQASYAQNRDDFEKVLRGSRELETFVSQGMKAIHDHQNRLSEFQIKIEQFKMKKQYLLDQMSEKYMVDLHEVAPSYRDSEGDRKLIEDEVKQLKEKISRIGEVNLSAIQEYEELIGRYQFLSQQFEDLTESKEQLRKVIERINRICSKRFKETFDQVNDRFMKVFPVLFGGGEARLILVEDEEKGEMGIDIVAKPPGKKSQNVGLLSGGEKALTAVALIFSIFLVKPSPFCLLDEVDAPLDDANVFRFNDLVKEMAKRSQIIIVTHNKHT